MEFDELKAAWHTLDKRIETGHALNAKVFTELKLERARSTLRPLWWLVSMQLAISLGAVVLLGSFLAGHWHLARFAVPAVLLDVTAVMSIVSAIGQLRVLNDIDYSQPVVAIQSKLTELAVRRAREVRWQWLLMLPLWTPLAVVVMQGIFGVDLYRLFGGRWIAANVAAGIVLTPLVVWLARHVGNRRDEIARRPVDDLAGRRLAEAQTCLDEVVAFETEM
jgi:hypothetical protein